MSWNQKDTLDLTGPRPLNKNASLSYGEISRCRELASWGDFKRFLQLDQKGRHERAMKLERTLPRGRVLRASLSRVLLLLDRRK